MLYYVTSEIEIVCCIVSLVRSQQSCSVVSLVRSIPVLCCLTCEIETVCCVVLLVRPQPCVVSAHRLMRTHVSQFVVGVVWRHLGAAQCRQVCRVALQCAALAATAAAPVATLRLLLQGLHIRLQ